MKIISPFGPKIAKLKFSSKLVEKINSEVDRIILKKNLTKKFDYSSKLVGQVKQELQLPKLFVKKNLEKTINFEVKKYIKKILNKKIDKILIKNFWIVRQFSNEYNPIHYHDGHISGVGYLKVPKFILKNKKKNNTDGTIDFVNGNKMFLSESIYNHQPNVGGVLLFPNYLMLTAYPFTANGERSSFSSYLEFAKKNTEIFTK